jgi:hypothetical protein
VEKTLLIAEDGIARCADLSAKSNAMPSSTPTNADPAGA